MNLKFANVLVYVATPKLMKPFFVLTKIASVVSIQFLGNIRDIYLLEVIYLIKRPITCFIMIRKTDNNTRLMCFERDVDKWIVESLLN